jgi:putative ABC transport system substrate-binding protein
MMRRREFITGLGSAAAWPMVARAQQGELVRRIGVLMTQAESDRQQQSFLAAFDMRLREFGWTDGKNVRIDYRWSGGEGRIAPLAKELVELKPNVLFAANTSCAVALRRYTLAIPIVFVQIADPVAAGLVTNLARPEGNITGFTNYEYAIGGKWIQALKEAAPGLRRAAVVFDPASASWPLYVRAVEAAAPSLGVQLIPAPIQSEAEIERAFAAFAAEPDGAVIAVPTASVNLRREKIIALAARHHLPAMYPYRYYAAEGGLTSYGTDPADQYRQAASYVDRLLKGEKPANLPIQQATKFRLVINLTTAKALGLTIPETLLATADEVIQ